MTRDRSGFLMSGFWGSTAHESTASRGAEEVNPGNGAAPLCQTCGGSKPGSLRPIDTGRTAGVSLSAVSRSRPVRRILCGELAAEGCSEARCSSRSSPLTMPRKSAPAVHLWNCRQPNDQCNRCVRFMQFRDWIRRSGFMGCMGVIGLMGLIGPMGPVGPIRTVCLNECRHRIHLFLRSQPPRDGVFLSSPRVLHSQQIYADLLSPAGATRD